MYNQAELAKKSEDLRDLLDRRRDLNDQIERLKKDIQSEVEKTGIDSLEIPLGDQVVLIKMNRRVTKSFDKNTLASELEMDRSVLDYYGISQLVEEGVIDSEVVKGYQVEKESKFISVRVVG